MMRAIGLPKDDIARVYRGHCYVIAGAKDSDSSSFAWERKSQICVEPLRGLPR